VVRAETFLYDGGRRGTLHGPRGPPQALVFAADGGWHLGRLVDALDDATTAVVGVHGRADDDGRLKEYSPGFDPDRFAAHEQFFVDEVREWVHALLGLALPAERTAVWGASVGGELALALGLRHPDVYGSVFCASPGGGYHPPEPLPASLPRTYLVGGTEEPWFLANAWRWADALAAGGADVVMTERAGGHGDDFWYQEFARMVRWAFPPDAA
jgi:enterochelin esterase-like enzyme